LYRIIELSGIIEKLKDFQTKYFETQELLEQKKKEYEGSRYKYSQQIDEKKLTIVYLTNEKIEFLSRIKYYENKIEDMKKAQEEDRISDININTQFKLLRQTINEQSENIAMLSNEVEDWRVIASKMKKNFNDEHKENIGLGIKISKLVDEINLLKTQKRVV